MERTTNAQVADQLDEVATLLEAQDASAFRVRAWRRGAEVVRRLHEPIAEIALCDHPGALEELPGIGPTLARAIRQVVRRGRLGMLDRLRGEVGPEDLLTTVPGIGEVLAHRIHATLGVDSLPALELAAHDGRLERVPGVGRRRAAAVRDVLASRLGRRRRPPDLEPPIDLLLEVDREYRALARAGKLPTIAPRRFNPEHEAWLPIYHAEREGWQLTALYSNTALAHELGHTRDWVVVYYERDGHEGQCTVVDGHSGRVVRGRERESVAVRDRIGGTAPAA